MDPLTALVVGSTAFSALSSISQGRSAQVMGEYNAKVAEVDAQAKRQAAEFEASRHQRETLRLLGSQRAAFASSGVEVGAGSPLLVASDTAGEAELDRLAILYGGEIGASQSMATAAAERLAGRAAATRGVMRAGESLLSGAAAVAKIHGLGPAGPES